MTRAVSIVIPTWNGLELLKRFLPTVIEAATQYGTNCDDPTEIVIVDDASVDQSVPWLVSQGFAISSSSGEPGSSLRILKNETNLGFGEACNRGFEAASYPLVFLLNNDVAVGSNSIAPLVENFADESVFAVHCRVFELGSAEECGTGKLGSFARGFIRVHRSYTPNPAYGEASLVGRDSRIRAPLYSMFAGGGSSMFDREKFITIGGFSKLLSPFYWEDVEISYRAWKRGFTVLYEPRSVTHHRISSTIRKLNRREVRKIEQRNRLIYHWIHLHDWSYMASHVFWVFILGLTALISFRPSFVLSLIAALKRLPEIRKRRLEERQAARLSDRDLFEIFASLEKRAEVVAYDRYSELAQLDSAKRETDLTV